MRALLKHLTVFLATLIVGIGAAFALLLLPPAQTAFSSPGVTETAQTQNPRTISNTEVVRAEAVKTVKKPETAPNPLDKVWANDRGLFYKGYGIKKTCVTNNVEYRNLDCKLKITKNGKTLEAFTADYILENWLQFGLFNFLGGRDKQLIVHTYSGGAHCCYDYMIYDLSPGFRKIYDSRKYDAANDIGNELFPEDMDGDGVYEFRRDVMAYDSFHASHADSVFPPAIFEYDPKKRQFDFARRRFSSYFKSEILQSQRWLEWGRQTCKNESPDSCKLTERWFVRAKFLNLIYGGRQTEGWKYFEENYIFEDKESYRKDIKDAFRDDVTYRSIYR